MWIVRVSSGQGKLKLTLPENVARDLQVAPGDSIVFVRTSDGRYVLDNATKLINHQLRGKL